MHRFTRAALFVTLILLLPTSLGALTADPVRLVAPAEPARALNSA